MLRGVVDCPELPLNVSRSYLQNSGYVTKMSQHIVKKVADKLNSLFNTEREKYEGLWPDIKIFAEYGCLRDRKFYDRVKGSILYPLTSGKTVTLDEYLESAKEKHENTVYYATDKAVADLERAEEDAQQRFQTQQDQVSEDEAKALDNQALYAEARGDRGGVGQAQYGQIQAAAMQNRRAINTARTQLATDTARQIADLRAQGEYEKADALLQLTQTYLGQLVELQQWGAEYALSVEQFNQQLIQWEKEFNLQSEQWKTQFDYTVSQNDRAYLAEAGMAALAAGIRPSAAQQQAMGYTDAQVTAALNAYKLAQATGVTVDAGGKIIDPQLDPYGYLYAKGVTDRNVVLSNLASIFKDSGDYVDFEAMADEYIRLVEEWKKAEEYANMEIDEEDTYKKFGRMVNPEWLSEQVASGALVEYEYNGKIRFARSPYASVFSSSFGGGANFNTFAGGKGGM